MLPRSFRQSSAKKAIFLLERSISSSKHSLKQAKETSGYVRSQPKVELPPEAKASPAAMPKPPSSQSPSSAGSTSSSSPSWQFHPSIPVDVRLLGAGALGTGALLYSLSGSGGGSDDNDNDKKRSNSGEENVFVIEDESTTSTTLEPNSGVEEVVVKEDTILENDSQTSSSLVAEDKTDSQTSKIKKEEEESEPAIVVDSHEVLKLIEDVLSKPAEQMLSEDEAALAGNTSNTNSATLSTREEEEKQKVEVQAAQVAITTAISDTAAESVASDIVKASKGVDAMNPAISHHHENTVNAPVSPKTTTTIISDSLASASATLAGINTDVINILGLHADLTAAGLLSDAIKSGAGPGDNWEEYAYRHKQAESDAEILGSLLDSAAQNVKKQLAAAQAAAIAGHEEAEEAKKEAAQQAERFRAALADALQRAEEGHRVQMNQQAEKLANAHAEMTVRERVERQKLVDQLRNKLGALERALEKRADAARGSTTVHRMAQGAFALQETLDKGGQVDQAAEFLASSACGNDPLISAAVRALPRGKRILTPVQLTDEFACVEKAVKELSLLPAGHGGLLSAGVAKLVSKLKLKESKNASLMLDSSNSVGIDAKLGEIEAEVVCGRYTQAAKKLEEAVDGTAAAVAVKDWVDAARARAAAEQAIAVVEAHAATAALSLA